MSPGRGKAPEIPDFSDTFIYIQPGALFPRHFSYKTVLTEDYSPEDRIVVEGIPVSIKVASFSVEIVIEGDMDEAMAVAIVQDIKEGIEADTGLSLSLEGYD